MIAIKIWAALNRPAQVAAPAVDVNRRLQHATDAVDWIADGLRLLGNREGSSLTAPHLEVVDLSRFAVGSIGVLQGTSATTTS